MADDADFSFTAPQWADNHKTPSAPISLALGEDASMAPPIHQPSHSQLSIYN